MSEAKLAALSHSAFILVERGGAYDSAYAANVTVCLDRKLLEEMAETHQKKQRVSRIRLAERSYMEIEEIPYLPNVRVGDYPEVIHSRQASLDENKIANSTRGNRGLRRKSKPCSPQRKS